jgi:cobalt/nickel transport system permease protein
VTEAVLDAAAAAGPTTAVPAPAPAAAPAGGAAALPPPGGAAQAAAAGAGRPSLIGGLDPRAKLVLVLGSLLVVLSEPPGVVAPFGPYLALTAVLLLLARVPPLFLARRLAAVAPILLFAAALLWLAGGDGMGPDRALSLVLRGFAAVALVSVLVATERMSGILWGLSALGMPRLFCTLSAFMYRYALLLGDEAMRTDRARRSRTPDRIRAGRLRTLGGQAALVFLRGWKRSRAVYSAMLARGFSGHFPFPAPGPLPAGDVATVAATLLPFLAVRLLWP